MGYFVIFLENTGWFFIVYGLKRASIILMSIKLGRVCSLGGINSKNLNQIITYNRKYYAIRHKEIEKCNNISLCLLYISVKTRDIRLP